MAAVDRAVVVVVVVWYPAVRTVVAAGVDPDTVGMAVEVVVVVAREWEDRAWWEKEERTEITVGAGAEGFISCGNGSSLAKRVVASAVDCSRRSASKVSQCGEASRRSVGVASSVWPSQWTEFALDEMVPRLSNILPSARTVLYDALLPLGNDDVSPLLMHVKV
jgi:hypothetical protein